MSVVTGVTDAGLMTTVLPAAIAGASFHAAVVETKLAESDGAAAADGEAALAELARAIRSHVTRTTGLAIRHLKLVPPGGIQKTTSGKLARAATRERYADAFLPA